MKRRKYAPPEELLAEAAMNGDVGALFELKEPYKKLMCYALNREIRMSSELYGFEEELYGFDDLLGDMGIIFDNAVMDFEKIED